MSYKCGEVIVKCKPFVHILNASEKSFRCDSCFDKKESLKKCGNCKQMYYCDKNCQKQDWIECHKNECKIFIRFGQYLSEDCDRFLLRLWLLCKFKNEKKSETYELHNGLKRSFNDLMTHSKEIRKDIKRKKLFDDICNRFKLCHIDFDFEELFELFCKICINSFSILNDHLNGIGSALYISGSVFNHSCASNASTIYDGIDMEVRAMKDINSGEEVFIHYFNIRFDRKERMTKLRELYYFDCNCLKCEKESHSDTNIDYNLVKSLEKQFDELIVQRDWNKCYSIGIKTIPLFHQIYGDFHPSLTMQLIQLLKIKAMIGKTSVRKSKSELDLIRKTKQSIKITHGFQSQVYDSFHSLTGL